MEIIKIQATVNASVEKVWDFYTNPIYITKWNFASPDWHCPTAENDLRIGGNYKVRMEAKDGSFGFDLEAMYNEVELGKKFVFTMADKRKVSVNFEDLSSTTNVTVVFEAESENSVELQRQGWQAILNNFKKYTESN